MNTEPKKRPTGVVGHHVIWTFHDEIVAGPYPKAVAMEFAAKLNKREMFARVELRMCHHQAISQNRMLSQSA